jgi:1-acyl-sn-glycerol-3-phosphate acyltransferase
MMFYRFARTLCRIYFRLVNRWEVIGHENIPQQGGVLICPNHISNFDPPLVGSAMSRPIRFMAKEELFKVPVLSFLIKDLGAFPVKRGAGDRQAIRQSLQILENGEVLGIFPEGSRSKSGGLEEAHSGAAFFALKTDATVVPVAIVGSFAPFAKIKIIFGTPLDLSAYRDQKGSKETLAEITSLIMTSIQKLIEQHR